MHGMTQFTKFTERYAGNDTVHKLFWEGTVLRVVEMAPFTKLTYKCSKVDGSPWRDIKGSWTASHGLEDF